jgi:hypothetical protein
MKEDMLSVRRAYLECHQNAPSQPKEPLVDRRAPDYPFQLVCADFYSLKGHQYLVLVDRYSGWPSVNRPKLEASAREVVRVLQAHCETFGVPEELSTDWGPRYTA